MSFSSLPRSLKAFIVIALAGGGASLGSALAAPASIDLPLLSVLLPAAVLLGALRLPLTVRGSPVSLAPAAACLALLLLGDLAAMLCALAGSIAGVLVRPAPGKWLPRIEWAEPVRAALAAGLHVSACFLGALVYHALTDAAPAGISPGRIAGVLAFQAVNFGVNSAGLAVSLGLWKGRGPWRVWKESFLWTWPGYFASGGIALAALAGRDPETYAWLGAVALLVLPLVLLLVSSFRAYREKIDVYDTKLDQDRRHVGELRELNTAIIASLARAIDAKDRYSRSHVTRVQMYAVGLAEATCLTGPELEAVRTGALIHDIGKLGIPERILGKPGKLTPEEYRRMQAHVSIGVEILAQVPFPWPVLPIVLTHHERWDGLGYPQGLKGEQIPIGGRIMSIADVFDALTSNRPYRRAMTPEDALDVIREGSGRLFDPALVEHFCRILPSVRTRIEELEAREAAGARSDGGPADAQRNWAFSLITQAAAEMSATCELAEGLAETTTVREVIDVVIDRTLRLLPADTAVIYICDDATGELRAEGTGGLHADIIAGLSIHRGEGVAGWVAESLQAQINAPAAIDLGRRFKPGVPMDLSSAAAVPLVQGASTVGVLALYTCSFSMLSEHHLAVLNIIAEHAAAALASAARYEETRELSLMDPLTGLPNSRSLIHHVERLCGQWSGLEPEHVPGRFAVLMFDLDGFKGINDTLGHLRGDEVLSEFGQVLKTLSRDQDLPCRYAGDEFVVVLNESDDHLAEQFVERVRLELFKRSEGWVGEQVTVSAGAACFPADGREVRSLLAVADERMYSDKFGRRSRPLPGYTHEDERGEGPPPPELV